MSAVQGHQLETQAYIRLLRSENSALRKQIEDSVEATARARSPELPTYDDVDLIDFLQRQCQQLNAEKDILLAEVTKLKNTPCNDMAHADALERVSILSKQLSDARDFEDKEKQLMRDRIQELEQAYCQHATEIEEERSPVEESGWTLVQSSPRSKAFDLAAFVGDIWKHQVVIPKKYEGPFSDIEDLQVPKEADALMPHGYLSFSDAQIIWRSAGADLFVGLVPKQVAKSIDGGRNIRWEDNIIQRHLGVRSAGQRREMLFLHNHTWHYYGQYECVGSVPLTAKQVEGLGYKKMIPYVILRTLIDSYGAVPRTKDRIFDQYSQGQLKIQCFAFKRVAFNEPLSKFLTKNGVWSSP